MHDPVNNRFVLATPELQAAFAKSPKENTPAERIQRDWTRFHEGEHLNVKGVNFKVHEIGEKRMVLKIA